MAWHESSSNGLAAAAVELCVCLAWLMWFWLLSMLLQCISCRGVNLMVFCTRLYAFFEVICLFCLACASIDGAHNFCLLHMWQDVAEVSGMYDKGGVCFAFGRGFFPLYNVFTAFSLLG